MIAEAVRLSLVPLLAWAAWSDHRTRLVPSRTFYPHITAGSALLVADLWGMHPATAVKLASPVLLLSGAALVFWAAGSFGLADVKAIAAIAALFPHDAATAVVLGLAISLAWPLSVAFRNAREGRWGRGMASVRVVPGDRIDSEHGWLADTGEDLEDVDPGDLPDGPVRITPGVPSDRKSVV